MAVKQTLLWFAPDTVKKLHPRHKGIATALAFFTIPLSGFITDMYMPSMPAMSLALKQSDTAIQFTLTLFLLSYALTQFITGPFMDSFGRYRLTLVALLLFIGSNIGIALTLHIEVIYAMRVLQGVAIGCIGVSKRSFFVDVHEGEKRKHYLSLMSIVWSIAPIVAPFIGGYLQHYFDWQASFYLLAVYASLLLVLELLFSGETVPEYRPFKLASILENYGVMLRTPLFLYGVICVGLSYGTIMVFNLAGAFIIEHGMGYTPVVAGYASLFMGIAWLCGGFLGKLLINRPFLPKLRTASFLELVAISLMIISTYWWQNLYSLVFFAFLVHIGVGFIFNIYFAYCIGRFPKMAGISSGFIGGSAFFITSIFSYGVVGMIGPETQQGLGFSYLALCLFIFVTLQFLARSEKKGTPTFEND